MDSKKAFKGKMPKWLKSRLHEKKEKQRLEIEVKTIVPKSVSNDIVSRQAIKKVEIEQIYLPAEVGKSFSKKIGFDPEEQVEEWRIRRFDSKCFFTTKSSGTVAGISRVENEVEIDEKKFQVLKESATKADKKLHALRKTRYVFISTFAGEKVKVEIDDFQEILGENKYLDFVVCEIEVKRLELAKILLSRRFFAPELLFLTRGIIVSNIKEFSNRYLAQYGFVAETFSAIKKWLRLHYIDNLKRLLDDIQDEMSHRELSSAYELLGKIENTSCEKPIEIDINDIGLTQDILSGLSFKVSDSLGRKDEGDFQLKRLDSLGKGWLRDYHTIISANFYIRLQTKPQIFRPGLGYTNTTTRAAHTSDVIALSIQLARQLGLNSELCMAIAALHDVGHPAGGHVGEELLKEFSGRSFKHHVFSLSLADIFHLNLLKEVQIGAYYHKSGGKNLMAPKGCPQEYGIVRIADKLSYSPWDFFDSIANKYINPDEIDHIPWLFEILGREPMVWIQNLTNAVVTESSEAHKVQFTEKSGDMFKAYKLARDLVKKYVHPNINWETLRAQMWSCYQYIEKSFPDVDPVAVVGYMTDYEIMRLSTILESQPKSQLLKLQELEILGFGFSELIRILQDPAFNSSNLYYGEVKEDINEQNADSKNEQKKHLIRGR